VGATFEELATDPLGAIEFVKDQQMFEVSKIGLIGMMLGARINDHRMAKKKEGGG
jgi:hypothetical protein